MIDGLQFIRIVRSPGQLPGAGRADHPADRSWRPLARASRRRAIGVHEYLLKPVSTKALLERIVGGAAQAAPDGATRRLLRPAPRKLGRCWPTVMPAAATTSDVLLLQVNRIKSVEPLARRD